MEITYYYVLLSNPYKIETTDLIDELVVLLYDGSAEFISDGQRIEAKLPDNYIDLLKKEISQYEQRVPLYDITYNHIFLIYKENIYPRIHNDNYRFIDKDFYRDLELISNPSDTDKENIRILSHYDLDVLYKTYLKIFYQSFVLNSYITNCRRPSFFSRMDHITPYYSINELYFLAYDWNLTDKVTLSEDEIKKFCKEISQYDIPAQTLLDHQIYIYDSKAIGLVKHYSLFGSYYMNVYLRKHKCCLQGSQIDYHQVVRNTYLENQIKLMIKLIKNAPAFTNTHTVYRFIEKDDYLKQVRIGDVYQDPSFMSTTRNPFYYKENYSFGVILIKIKIPQGIKGTALCIEAYSNFPREEEIIFPPTSKYRLIQVTDSKETAHIHNIYGLKVQKKYEFEWVGNDYSNKTDSEIELNMLGAQIPELNDIDLTKLLTDENIQYLSISDRLQYFKNTYVNNTNNQFASIINGRRYVFSFESYDSTTVYKPFFYYEESNGIMITTSNPKYGNINIMMELGPEIHINYYLKYSVTDPSIAVDLNNPEWIKWISLLTYIVGSRSAVIHSRYVLQNNKSDTIEQKQMRTRYIFPYDIYAYMKTGEKLYVVPEIVPRFEYYYLDQLFKIPIDEYIKPTDLDELYRIAKISGTTNIGDFYLYVVEKYPKLIKQIEGKMDEIFDPEKNPFRNIEYNLNAWRYLYDHSLIKILPSEKEFRVTKGSFKKLVGDKKIQKFKNRLRMIVPK